MNLTKIKDLKQGDVVLYYGATFKVIEDAKESIFTDGVYIAKCKYTSGNPELSSYDYFKGNDSVERLVINK